jgi:RND family efflux transporter MFP subunit
MKSPAKIVGLAVIVIASFLAGTWYSSRNGGSKSTPAGRKILYWHDPMHPAYKSDRPGIAPDCGMQLEPVYEDGGPPASRDSAVLPPGTVQISPERQQLIGVRIGQVEKTSGMQSVRILGRVSVDETRIYKLNAAIEGWIREISPVTVGSVLQKDQLLASYYAPEFIGPQQAYLYAMSAMDRFQATGKETPEQIALTNANIQSAADTLRNMGMTDTQLEAMKKERQLTQRIEIRAPSAGFVLARNISPGQRFEKGTEFYRIADLSHVWILADVFENEGRYFRPGLTAKVTDKAQGKSFQARVSDVLPQFDPATRVLKVRLETDNPGYGLKPDVFVDVEFPLQWQPGLTIPSEAVLDTGMKKIVFVDRGNGFFEPRRVETGLRFGDRIEITKGLMEGERIVVSGNFLVDSESRLRLAAAGLPEDYVLDPVCGMGVDPRKAGEKKSVFCGQTFYFCNPECKARFDREPAKYVPKNSESRIQNQRCRRQKEAVRSRLGASWPGIWCAGWMWIPPRRGS